MSHCNHINIRASSVDYEMSGLWLNFPVVEIQVEEYNWLIEFSLNRVQHKETRWYNYCPQTDDGNLAEHWLNLYELVIARRTSRPD